MASTLIGRAVRRREDPALLAGKGQYVDDLHLPGMLHVAFVRSPYPKARVLDIDTSAARSAPGVVDVLTAADLDGAVTDMPVSRAVKGMQVPPHPVLARDQVHAVGMNVVAVVAETPAQALDGAALVDVSYDPLPSVADVESAVQPGAPLARDEAGTNICYTARREKGDVEAAFARADHVVSLRIDSPRLASVAIEPRGVVVQPEPFGEGLTVWASSQGSFRIRGDLATVLDLPENRIRVITRDVGGAFGTKSPVYREYVVAAHLALKLGRPVKWVATRSDDLATTIQGRDMVVFADLALKHDGTMTGLRVRSLANLGAYLHANTAGPPQRLLGMSPGCYKIPNVAIEVNAVFTNTVPTGAYRGAGRPESVLLIERLVDHAAHTMGMDPLVLRRKNFIQPSEFPYQTATGVVYDSGDYERALDKALAVSGYDRLLKERDEARARGEIMGIGVATFVEPSGGMGYESGTVRVDKTGRVTVITGSSSHGQGHHTVFAQVAAQHLGVPLEDVVIHHGDTFASQESIGTFGSRSAILGGSAIVTATGRVMEKARRIAANMLESSVDDVEQRDGGFAVVGAPDRRVSWKQVAASANAGKDLPPGDEPGLESVAFFQPEGEAYGFGSHLAVVRIDRDTARVHLEKLVAIDDCGNILNPLVVEGQVHGGIAQGLGQAFMEQVVFDQDGQLLSGSLGDYAVPRAADMPSLDTLVLDHTVTPSPTNPLGVKGVGESGTIGAPPAVLNAVVDALTPFGVTHLDMPLTAARVWQALRTAPANRSEAT